MTGSPERNISNSLNLPPEPELRAPSRPASFDRNNAPESSLKALGGLSTPGLPEQDSPETTAQETREKSFLASIVDSVKSGFQAIFRSGKEQEQETDTASERPDYVWSEEDESRYGFDKSHLEINLKEARDRDGDNGAYLGEERLTTNQKFHQMNLARSKFVTGKEEMIREALLSGGIASALELQEAKDSDA